ncbi:MAG: 3D domain-containing protein, partial [Desulfobacterales bacterium]|nr:3D domain-containing protein [Desulfobacterales bacterium]
YSGLTASGTKPHEPQPGLFSLDSLTHPWMVPFRLVFPWLWLPKDGTIAADTRYYPFGTHIYVPNYGYGVVEDRGGAIKGPKRLDLFYDSHSDALEWGRRHVDVKIY